MVYIRNNYPEQIFSLYKLWKTEMKYEKMENKKASSSSN